jgi:hypothetical protein
MEYSDAPHQLQALQAFHARIRELRIEGWTDDDAEQIALDEAKVRRGVDVIVIDEDIP